MKVNLRSDLNRSGVNIGDVIVLSDNTCILVTRDHDGRDYRLLNLDTMTPSTVRSNTASIVDYIHDVYDKSILRVIPRDRIEMSEM